MNMTRPVYLINNKAPGSDLMGSAAAALASSAIVFRNSDLEYSNKLADTASILYRYAALITKLLSLHLRDWECIIPED